MPRVTIARNILAANEEVAAAVRRRLAAAGVRCINLMSGPGAGKTTLLERSVARLRGRLAIGVIEGDIETSLDAERMEAAGAQVVQINTRGACHLEAHMVRDALEALDLQRLDLLFIENIGNLVCPAAWDLGEDLRVVVVCTTEGDEKPAKYPQIFAAAQVLVINKLDLLPYVDYDPERVRAQALAVNPGLQIFSLSCRSGEGLETWCEWLWHVGRVPGRSLPADREGPVIPKEGAAS
ncbi:hydrogenase nickel incorporation protein HypB [Thermogemmatispora tikiterensis]|uniref:Hydrogenase accessory protein HypB n=1 Tax=Thermogemmatispora tikiterensis TaxID=1825093 RepID=A0A328VMQ9_9CHLR|nr:hydrogenase nickel incorporation protein HypB [Thermogemmatispora tikiterensis]RAQ96414.1 hydrogenase accessory protein HypB [Thermogemmatispora tikiterensis]